MYAQRLAAQSVRIQVHEGALIVSGWGAGFFFTLSQAKGNKAKAARLLSLTRSQLYSRLKKHGFG